MSSPTPPIYFELSWSILSSIGLLSVFAGMLVVGITNLSFLSAVPIIVSAACAIANGLCYYAFYADYPIPGQVAAGAIADIMWLIQEAGLSFYSYQILIRFLRNKPRLYFLCIFWSLMTILLGIRICILVSRAMGILDGNDDLQTRVNHLHIGYFTIIALVEICSSYFLLQIFASGQKSSTVLLTKSNLFRQLTRSTEIRLASLSLVGITRAVTYSFQTEAQSASSVASQVDRFAYTLECFFPIIMMIDLMAARLIGSGYQEQSSSRRTARRHNGIELGKTNEDARQGMKRQTFVLIEPQEPKLPPPTPTLTERTEEGDEV